MGASLHTERGFDRLVNFSDAVVAIAITLLILPLVDIAGDAASHETPLDVLDKDNGTVWGFVISFVVLANYWLIHHRMFEWLDDYDAVLVWLNIGWLFSIVLLPFSTEAISTWGFSNGWGLVYTFNLALISMFLALIAWHARRTPDLLAGPYRPSQMRMRRSIILCGYFVAVGIFSLFQPVLASYSMLGLIPLGLILGRSDGEKFDGEPTGAVERT